MEIKADLHIHTVLSPCASLDMSPAKIVKAAKAKGLGMIGITDHNSTLQCRITYKLAQEAGIFALIGAEVTSIEEVHNLCFFENFDQLDSFQEFIEKKQPKVKHGDLLGAQVVVDENELILEEIEHYLGMALNAGIDEIEEKVHELGGIYIPAHINRGRFGLISQLGFVPHDIKADGLEVFNRLPATDVLEKYPYLKSFSLLKNSDSHVPETIGMYYSTFYVNELSFNEIKMALHKENGRNVSTL